MTFTLEAGRKLDLRSSRDNEKLKVKTDEGGERKRVNDEQILIRE